MIKSKEEGWCFYRGHIEAEDRSNFANSSDSWHEAHAKALEFVKARAAEGSGLHQRAVAMVIEHKLKNPQ